jgi:hypothetical protein
MIKKCILLLFLILATARPASAHGVINYIFNLPTAQTTGSNILLLDVGHRYFDPIRHTTNVNITLGYGITDSLDIYTGESFKNLDTIGGLKLNMLDDSSNQPDAISLAVHLGGGYKIDTEKTLKSRVRPSFFIEPIIQKTLFKNEVSFGLVPVFAYNTNFYKINTKYDYSIGVGIFIEVFVSERVAIAGEAITNLYGFAFKYMNYNAGLKYVGYRHTYALWIGNSAGYSPVEYIAGNRVLTPRVSFTFTREFDI